jgi:hypothetical protein
VVPTDVFPGFLKALHGDRIVITTQNSLSLFMLRTESGLHRLLAESVLFLTPVVVWSVPVPPWADFDEFYCRGRELLPRDGGLIKGPAIRLFLLHTASGYGNAAARIAYETCSAICEESFETAMISCRRSAVAGNSNAHNAYGVLLKNLLTAVRVLSDGQNHDGSAEWRGC